ncbi:hypothetical protein L6452_42131 [Arctium lappa]|uniref:Uncharacterized protein n=1 Tax=Arctium lappa TaxID=4217 RepID=A0ACB8XIK8_ARCLA|nr:hypothetical protein L6452_42131 [Arctium lappa]
MVLAALRAIISTHLWLQNCISCNFCTVREQFSARYWSILYSSDLSGKSLQQFKSLATRCILDVLQVYGLANIGIRH